MSRPFFRPILAIPLSQWNDLVLVINTVTGINQQIRTTERMKSNGIILGACNDFTIEALLPRGNGNVEEFDQRTTQRHYQISSTFRVGLVKTLKGSASIWHASCVNRLWLEHKFRGKEKCSGGPRDLVEIRGVPVPFRR